MFIYRRIEDPREILPIAAKAFAIPFPEQDSAEAWLTSAISDGHELYGVYEDDQLLAGFLLYDYRMRLRNDIVPMGGIGLLCSRMDARGQGAVRHMIARSLSTMQESGFAVSVLDPFNESFYRKYGWEKLSRLKVIEVPPSQLDLPEDLDSQQWVATDLPFPDTASMDFYNAYAARHHTLAQRQAREWRQRTEIRAWNSKTVARGIVRFEHDERVAGLIGYSVLQGSGDFETIFAINLLAFEEERALREILRYIKRLSHQISLVRIDLPLDYDLWPYLTHRPDRWTIYDKFMLRIVSLEALDGLTIDAPDLSVRVDVEDSQASWNQQIWELAIADHVLHVRRAASADLRCRIAALSGVLSGFTDFRTMLASRRVEALPSYRGQDLPRTVNYLADYF